MYEVCSKLTMKSSKTSDFTDYSCVSVVGFKQGTVGWEGKSYVFNNRKSHATKAYIVRIV